MLSSNFIQPGVDRLLLELGKSFVAGLENGTLLDRESALQCIGQHLCDRDAAGLTGRLLRLTGRMIRERHRIGPSTTRHTARTLVLGSHCLPLLRLASIGSDVGGGALQRRRVRLRLVIVHELWLDPHVVTAVDARAIVGGFPRDRFRADVLDVTGPTDDPVRHRGRLEVRRIGNAERVQLVGDCVDESARVWLHTRDQDWEPTLTTLGK